jgi:hypothetical protein
MGRPVTIGIVTVAVGETYQNFLPQWAIAVAHLATPPDQITIVVDHLPEHEVRMLDEILGSWQLLTSTTKWVNNPQILANEAISITDTDWICKLDADDLIYPHALDTIKDCPVDVCMFGINVNGKVNMIPPNVTAQQVLDSPDNLLFAGSPFRKTIWEKTPGFQDIIYDDWAFWRACAKAEATFQPTGTIDYLYRLHENNSSTGVNHAEASAEVFRREQ